MSVETIPEHDPTPLHLIGEEVEAEHDLDLADFDFDTDDFDVDFMMEGRALKASWYPAPCITALQRDLDQVFPKRVKPDWILGDADHSARDSDHNPDEGGMVHAIDIRHGGDLDVKRVLEATIGDPRTYYVISNRVIYSRTYNFAARAYTGSNPHDTHVHLSVRYLHTAEQNQSEWGLQKVRPATVDLYTVRRQFRIAQGIEKGQVSKRTSVRRVQMSLNTKNRAGLTADGIVGRRTIAAYAAWEKREKVPGLSRETVPDRKSLPPLVQPKWKVS